MEYLDYVINHAHKWLTETQTRLRTEDELILDDTVHVHVRTACITKAVVIANPSPSYYVGFHVILFIPPNSTKPSHTFPMVTHVPLQQQITKTCVKKYPEVMQRQDIAKQEITGIVACNPTDAMDIDLLFCVTLSNDTHSSEPHCGARRMCKRTELKPGWMLLGEFHSHPDSRTHHNRMVMAPPSDADMFQALVATMKGEHNASYVFAPEGIYRVVVTMQACRLFQHDLELFFDYAFASGKQEYNAAMAKCKQPIAKLVNPELKYLHCLLHEPLNWFHSICRERMSVLHMANWYMDLMREYLHLDIHLHPNKGALAQNHWRLCHPYGWVWVCHKTG